MPYNKPFAEEINTDQICEYGCSQVAKYRFRKGKVCCSKHYNSCPGKRKEFSERSDHKERAAKSLKTRIDLGITKSSQIKAAITRKESGHYDRLAKKMQKHWQERPWNNHPKWDNYKETDIRIQSSYEFNFLEDLENEYGIDWVVKNVKRGHTFYYVDPKTDQKSLYISDFQIDDTIYEVKSLYSWNNKGENQELEELNKAKLDSVLKNNYNVVLVLEGKRIDYGKGTMGRTLSSKKN